MFYSILMIDLDNIYMHMHNPVLAFMFSLFCWDAQYVKIWQDGPVPFHILFHRFLYNINIWKAYYWVWRIQKCIFTVKDQHFQDHLWTHLPNSLIFELQFYLTTTWHWKWAYQLVPKIRLHIEDRLLEPDISDHTA